MDIGNLTSGLMNEYQINKNSASSKLEGQLDADFSTKTEAEMMEACKEFEGYFLEMMFKEMMKTVPKQESASSYGSSITDYYQDNMIQELASQSTESNGLGLAQMLYEQMKRNYDV